MNMVTPAAKSSREKAKSWILRFIKFNIIGFIVFLVGTAIFSLLFSRMGAWTWLAANAVGGVLQFTLVSYFNTKKKGIMFDTCKTE